ncbi:MAG: hypothetical protein AB1512_31985 [Thermodesulfobacteriota bacterium]
MGLSIRQVTCRSDLRRFIFLPEKLHARHPNWVPPLYLDEWNHFSPDKNRAFRYCETLFLLALQGRDVVGRILGIVNLRHNRYRDQKTARFACLEAPEDNEAVAALLGRVEDWARKQGMNRIIGPYGFTDQDPEGFLIDGFEHTPTIGTYYNFEWMPRLVEGQGYAKEVDYVTYRIEIPSPFPEKYERMYERIRRRGTLEAVNLRKRKEAKAWAGRAFRLMNECYAAEGIFGFTPMDEEEMGQLLRRYLPLLDPRFLKGVKRGGDLAGFVIGVPDFTAGLRKARGRLLPFGFFHILQAMKKAEQLVLLLGAIRKEDRWLGIDMLLMMEMGMSAQKAGFRVVDTHHQMETNRKIRGMSEWLGGSVYKRHRVYGKDI